MSWKIGGVTLPVPPKRITKKNKVNIKKISSGIEAPWLYGMGADSKQLQMDGEIFDTSRYGRTDKSGIFVDYVQKLERYTEHGMAVMYPLIDIDPATTWAITAGTRKNTGSKFVKNDECLFVEFGANNVNLYYEFDEALDFRNNNLVSVWIKAANNVDLAMTFWEETYTSRNDGYRQYIKPSGANWEQHVFVMSGEDGDLVFNKINTPKDWRIRTVMIEPSGAYNPAGQDIYLDVAMISLGWKVSSPNGWYNGIWMIDDFQYEEDGADTESSFKYRMMLVDNSDLHGRITKAVS